MKSAELGRNISSVEVTNVSAHGFWLFVGERELFVAFEQFPWFRDASIRAITNVQLPSGHHLYWPDLDIDLAVESIEHPDKYPLISHAHPKGPPWLALRTDEVQAGNVTRLELHQHIDVAVPIEVIAERRSKQALDNAAINAVVTLDDDHFGTRRM